MSLKEKKAKLILQINALNKVWNISDLDILSRIVDDISKGKSISEQPKTHDNIKIKGYLEQRIDALGRNPEIDALYKKKEEGLKRIDEKIKLIRYAN